MTLNIGILGPGRFVRACLAPAIAKASKARLWSVLGRDPDRIQAFAAKYGATAPVPGFTELDTFLAYPALDVVVITTRDHLHAETEMAAIRRGKHLLISAPLVTDLEAGRRLMIAAEAQGLCVGVTHHLRHHKGHQLVADQIHSGVLGDIHYPKIRS